MSDTPRTDTMIAADQHHLEDDNFFPATVYWRMCDIARELECELAEVTEQRDRLADFACDVAESSSSTRHRCLAKQALAAVKGGTP